MEKLKFSFWNDDELLIDEEVEYRIENEYIIIDYERSVFKFKFGNDFHFIKETEYDLFQISSVPSKKECLYTLKSENVTFEIGLLMIETKTQDKKHIIKYNIESDVEDDVCSTKKDYFRFILIKS